MKCKEFILKYLIGFRLFVSLLQNLQSSGCIKLMSQMPVVLLPLHFDRDPANRTPSCLRSVVLRPFITSDFMTGVPVVPGTSQMPMNVSRSIFGNFWYLVWK